MFRLNVGNFGVLLYDVPLHVEVRVTTLDLEALIFGLMWSRRNASHPHSCYASTFDGRVKDRRLEK